MRHPAAQRVYEQRAALGQREYGVGKENAGYHRDNIQDAFEEICDAAIILQFARERLSQNANISRRLLFIHQEFGMLMDYMAELQIEIEKEFPSYVEDGVTRPAYLAKSRSGAIE